MWWVAIGEGRFANRPYGGWGRWRGARFFEGIGRVGEGAHEGRPYGGWVWRYGIGENYQGGRRCKVGGWVPAFARTTGEGGGADSSRGSEWRVGEGAHKGCPYEGMCSWVVMGEGWFASAPLRMGSWLCKGHIGGSRTAPRWIEVVSERGEGNEIPRLRFAPNSE